MLMSTHTRKTDQGRQAISHCFCEWTGIFVGDDSCYGPCSCGMPRGEGGATALKKCSAAIALIGSFAPQRVLQSLDRYPAIYGRLTGQKSGLAPVLVVFNVTQHPHSSGPTDECCYTGVRKCLVVTNRRRTLRQVLAEIAVRHEKPRR